MNTVDIIKVVSAFERGEDLQSKRKGSTNWSNVDRKTFKGFDFVNYDYRIEPENPYCPDKTEIDYVFEKNIQEMKNAGLEKATIDIDMLIRVVNEIRSLRSAAINLYQIKEYYKSICEEIGMACNE